MNWKFRIIYLLLFFSCLIVTGQENKPLRIEFETSTKARPYNLILLNDHGLILYYKLPQLSKNGLDQWYFKYYDIYLNKVWERTVEIGKGFNYARHFYSGDTLHIAYFNKLSGRASIQLLTVDLANGSAKSKYFEVTGKSEITRFLIYGDKVFFATNDKRFISRLHIGDLRDGSVKSLLLLEKYESWISDMDLDTLNEQLILTMQYNGQKAGNIIRIYQVDFDGDIINSTDITGNDKSKMLIAADLTIVDSTRFMIFGSYTAKSRQKSYSSDHPNLSKSLGIYSLDVSDGEPGEANYYKYSDFNNFYDHLTYDDVSRMKKNKDQKPAVDFHALPHKTIEYRGGFIFLLEAYFPKYQYVTRTEYDFYGRPYPYSYSVFQGYQYTNAFIAWLDSTGIKKWDNNFEIRNILEDDLRKRVSLLFDDKDVVMTYNFMGQIAAQVITEDVSAGEIEYFPIESLHKGDAVLENYEGSIVYWYDNYIICYGYQKISNPANRDVPKRTVFYINKVAYR